MIRFQYRNRFHDILGVARFATAKLYYGKRLCGPWLSTVEQGCTLALASRNAIASIGGKCRINSSCFIYNSGSLEIGSRCFLNSFTRIVCHKEIRIGSSCLFGPYSSVLDHNHKVDFLNGQLIREQMDTAAVHIGNNVWIGEKATVLMGVTIGENSVIGAGSVVTKSIPANCVAAGVPARVIRELHDERG